MIENQRRSICFDFKINHHDDRLKICWCFSWVSFFLGDHRLYHSVVVRQMMKCKDTSEFFSLAHYLMVFPEEIIQNRVWNQEKKSQITERYPWTCKRVNQSSLLKKTAAKSSLFFMIFKCVQHSTVCLYVTPMRKVSWKRYWVFEFP